MPRTLSIFAENGLAKGLFLALLCAAALLGGGALKAHAATVYFSPASVTAKNNEVFKVDVLVDAEGKELNAVAVGFMYPKDLLKVEEVSEGGSIFTYWVERAVAGDNGIVRFQGTITGSGFNGNSGKLVSLYFRTLKSGNATISIDESSSVFLNDGKGTRLTPQLRSLAVAVGSEMAAAQEGPVYADTDAPAIFDYVVSRSPDLFGNQNFLAFSVRDEGSGVDYVEVKEGSMEYVRAESPYLLQNQSLDADISIRAVDKVGNVRIEVIKLGRSRWPEIAGGAAVLLVAAWILWRRFAK